MNFIEELKRRNVFRVGIAYIVVAWLVAQIADLVLDNIQSPDWVMQTILLLLAIGLPIVLIIAWAFELTPEGIKKEKDVDRSQSIRSNTGRKLDFTIIGLLVVGLMYFVWESRFSEDDINTASNVRNTNSIAVLPFVDMSAAGDQAYFADGIAEELLNLLARTEGLKVTARTSSFKFKNSDADISEIGRALKVKTVLEGSIRKSGDQLRITAQLIEVDGGFHLWSDTYDRKLDDIFAVQDEISKAIVDALKLKLNVGQQAAKHKVNSEAYDLYLRGLAVGRSPSKDGLLKAIEFYEQALAIDDSLAAAYSGIANAWVWLEDYGGYKGAVAYPKAEKAARRAMALDPNMAEAHAAMARVSDRYYSDLITAKQYFERATQLNPNSVDIYVTYGDTLDSLGERQLGLEKRRIAVEVDPLSIFNRVRLSGELNEIGFDEEAKKILDAVFQEEPDNDYAHETLANFYLLHGEYALAAREYQFVHKARPGDPYSASYLAFLGLVFEDQKMVEYWLAQARALGKDNRWELDTREHLLISKGDWLGQQELASRIGGSGGATFRGRALINLNKPAEARQSLLNALQLYGYKRGGQIITDYLHALINLLWTEQQLKMDGVLSHVTEVESFLNKLLVIKYIAFEWNNYDYQLAKLSAIRADRAAMFKHLNRAIKSGFGQHWLLGKEVFFEQWREDPEFLAIIAKMRSHAAKERGKLEQMEGGKEIMGYIN